MRQRILFVVVVFLATAVPFGLFTGVFLGAITGVLTRADAAGVGVGAAVVTGGFFGVLMTAALTTLDVIRRGGVRAQPGATLWPRQARRMTWACPHGVLEHHVREALRQLTGSEVSAGAAPDGSLRWEARTAVSWRTFGERICVSARPVAVAPAGFEGESPADSSQRWALRVVSRPRMRTTLVDYGAGERNVDGITRVLGAAGAQQAPERTSTQEF